MASNKNATYKRFNGTDWDTLYFATTAAQVGVSASRKFITSDTKVNNVSFSLNSTGDGASVTINGSHINYTGDTGNYITKATSLNTALAALDAAAKAAADAVPSGVLTTSNYSTTLASVYQAKDADLTAIAGLTGTSGLLKKTAANTWALDTTSYATATALSNHTGATNNPHSVTKSQVGLGNVVNTGDSATPVSGGTTKFTTGGAYTELAKKVDKTTTVNGKALSGNVILGAEDIDFVDVASASKVTIQNALSSVITTAEGKTSSFSIVSESGSPSTADNEFHVSKGTSTDQDATIKLIQAASVSNGIATLPVTIVTGGNGNSFTGDVENIKVKQGDIIYTAEPGVLDWWVVAVTDTGIIVSSHDSDKPDLSGYQTKITSSNKLAYSLISGTPTIPTTLPANGGTAENVSGTVAIAHGGTGATTADGARSNLGLGGAAVKGVETTLTNTNNNVPTSAAVKTFVEGKGYTTNTGTITEIKIGGVSKGTSGSVDLPAYPTSLPASNTTDTYSSTGTAPVSGKAVASALSSYRTTATRIFMQADAPTSGVNTGDIWLDI